MQQMKKLFSVLIALAFWSNGFAQQKVAPKAKPVVAQKSYAGVWRKDVTRRIDIELKAGAGGDTAKSEEEWRQFFVLLDGDLKAGKILAYNNYNYGLLTAKEIKELTKTSYDTIVVVDPVNGKEITKVMKHEFDFGTINKIRVREKWVYDEETGMTTIQITEIAPVRDIFVDGDYRGSQSIYWIKWDDFVKVCEQYTKADMLKMTGSLIWEDYFRDTALVKPKRRPEMQAIGAYGLERTALRNTRLLIEQDEDNTNLREVMDTSIAELLYNRALSGAVIVCKDDQNGPWGRMTSEELKKSITLPPDTLEVDDMGASGVEMRKIIYHDFCFECVNKYCVQEHWVQNMRKGTTVIDYAWIAPVKDSVVDGEYKGSNRLFWIKYNDAREILADHNSSHSRNNIEWQLWEDRFKEPRHKGRR